MPQTSTMLPLSMPTAAQPILGKGQDGKWDGKATQVWWRFWYALLQRTQETIPYVLATAQTAAGTTQATALQLTAEWNEITTAPLNSGVILPNFGAGFDSRVWNGGTNPLNIYPPIGCHIDNSAANAPYSLATNKAQIFSQLTAIHWRSLQLG